MENEKKQSEKKLKTTTSFHIADSLFAQVSKWFAETPDGVQLIDMSVPEEEEDNRMPIKDGMLLHGRYLVEKELGKGGMGQVFKVLDTKQQRKPRAIKRLLETDIKARKRFAKEYQILKNITHPNLIRAYECFEQDGELFMTLEFAEGKSMRNILEEGKKIFSLPEQLAIANKAARGVEVLHLAGIIHRDIKPDHIMICLNSGDVKLLDLGVGKDLFQKTRLTQTGMGVGSIPYMSPEQINCEPVTPAADVFALGVTLYQFFLWLKESPFMSSTCYATVSKIMEYNPPSIYDQMYKIIASQGKTLSKKESDSYLALSDLISKAMEKNAENRLAHAGIIADRCEEICNELMTMDNYQNAVTNIRLAIFTPKLNLKMTQRLEELRLKGEFEEMEATSEDPNVPPLDMQEEISKTQDSAANKASVPFWGTWIIAVMVGVFILWIFWIWVHFFLLDR